MSVPKVVCGSCGWRGNRVRQESVAAPFGPCPRCRATLTRSTTKLDRRCEKARAELAAQEGQASLR